MSDRETIREYRALMKMAKKRGLKRKGGSVEEHHPLPKSFVPNKIVVGLYLDEHYYAHRLLVRLSPKGMKRAFPTCPLSGEVMRGKMLLALKRMHDTGKYTVDSDEAQAEYVRIKSDPVYIETTRINARAGGQPGYRAGLGRLTPKQLSAAGRKAYATGLAKLTFEQRSAAGRIGGRNSTPEQKSAAGRAGYYAIGGLAHRTLEQRSAAGRVGYRIGLAHRTPEQRSAAGQIGGAIGGRVSAALRTYEEHSAWGRAMQASRTPEERSAIGVLGAKAFLQATTPKQRSDFARNATAALTPAERRANSLKGNAALTTEQRSAIGRARGRKCGPFGGRVTCAKRWGTPFVIGNWVIWLSRKIGRGQYALLLEQHNGRIVITA